MAVNERHCSVRLTRRYADPPDEVWKALTEPDSVARWLAPGFDLRPTVVEVGRVLELDWRPPGEPPSLVRFELAADGEGTVLVLDHSRINEQYGMRSMARWFSALERIPLRSR